MFQERTALLLLKELRQSCIKTPAIFITSLNMIEDVEKGFIAGCDDYIKKNHLNSKSWTFD